jgi:hypothetical protein
MSRQERRRGFALHSEAREKEFSKREIRKSNYKEYMSRVLAARGRARTSLISLVERGKFTNYTEMLPFMMALDNWVIHESKRASAKTGHFMEHGRERLKLIPKGELEKQILASAEARAKISKKPIQVEIQNIKNESENYFRQLNQKFKTKRPKAP